MGYTIIKDWNYFICYWYSNINLVNIKWRNILVDKNISLSKREYAMYFIGVGMGICLTLLVFSLILLVKLKGEGK